MQCVSPWWQQVRSACVQSHSSAAALLAAIVAHRAAKANITILAETKVTHHTHTYTYTSPGYGKEEGEHTHPSTHTLICVLRH